MRALRRQKRGLKVGKTKSGKGTKIMAVADRNGLPVSICVDSATPHEVKLATSTLVQMVVPDQLRTANWADSSLSNSCPMNSLFGTRIRESAGVC